MRRPRPFADATDYKGRVLLYVGTRAAGGTQSISIFLTAAASGRLRKDLRAAEQRARAVAKARRANARREIKP